MPHHNIDSEDISWLHHWFHEVIDNPQIALLIMGAMIGWIIYWLRTMFVTHKVMQQIDEKNEEAHERIASDLHEVKETVSWMKGFMEKHHGKD